VEAAGRRGIKVVAYYNALDLINARDGVLEARVRWLRIHAAVRVAP